MSTSLGIDLAAAPRRTAACWLEWDGDGAIVAARVEPGGLDNDALVALVAVADHVGIDAPFAWPAAFRSLVAGGWSHGPWGASDTPDRRALVYRETDLVVQRQLGKWPLSSVGSYLGVTALRCVSLLHAIGAAPDLADPRGGVWRTGSTEVFEVYPGGALLQWGVHAAGYKRDDARAARRRILDALLQRWPVPDPDALAACVAGDDALDAFAAAIVAHLASCGETIAPDAPLTDPTEGWIHLPVG